MSGTVWLVILTILLTLLGAASLVLITIRYYWGERGNPPPTGPARRAQKEQELRLRAGQIEKLARTPREPRNPSFFDNTKQKPDRQSGSAHDSHLSNS